ncbi:MAG: metallophosphoesterase [Nitrospirota bacterium]|jgi:3',5'-cyclic AMP phosphodiesterase CpdA
MADKDVKNRASGSEGGRPGFSRRDFLRATTFVAAGAAAHGVLPVFSRIDLAFGASSFSFAWISDSHLYPRELNTRFIEKLKRAVKDVNEMSPAPDFLLYGGDLAQLGDPVELELGVELLKPIKVKKYYIPGEHDWYLDLGKKWMDLFGKPNWSFDHKGVRIIGLDTVGHAPDYWSAKNMSPQERMGHMATLDGSVAGPWSGLGREQRDWLSKTLSDWPKDKPVILFSHNPLYEYYPPWNFWIRDWREVHEILGPYQNVTNVHGHTHQVLYNEVGNMRSIGMLATAWNWPYPPQGVPELTKPMVRVDPGDHFDGVGWSKLKMTPDMKVENKYVMWRKDEDIFAEKAVDSGTGDNMNQRLSPRIADKMWQYEVE